MVALSSLVGGGGGGVCPSFWFQTGCAGWTPPRDGCAVVHIIGAGAGTSANAACGGGAGGYIRYATEFTTGDSPYCIVVGSGGHYTGGCSMMCGGSPAWSMIAYGACCSIGGAVSFSTCPNGTNMTFACGGCGVGSGGAVGLFASPGGIGFNGTSATVGAQNFSGGAGVGGQGSPGVRCTGAGGPWIVIGGGGGSAGPAPQSFSAFEAYGMDCTAFSHGGPALVITPAQHSKYFKFISQWGCGGYLKRSFPGGTICGPINANTAGVGGGGHGGSCDIGAGAGGAFAGGGFGPGGAFGGYPGGGGGAGSTCSARCMCVCGGDGAVIVEYIEV